jgi:hypothetical protein
VAFLYQVSICRSNPERSGSAARQECFPAKLIGGNQLEKTIRELTISAASPTTPMGSIQARTAQATRSNQQPKMNRTALGWSREISA